MALAQRETQYGHFATHAAAPSGSSVAFTAPGVGAAAVSRGGRMRAVIQAAGACARGRWHRGLLLSAVLGTLIFLMVPAGAASAQPADAAAVAGSWKVDTVDQSNSNSDPASCWTLAIGDTITITEVGTEKLTLAL